MWISRKAFRTRCLEEYQLGLRQGIGIGRNQIRRVILAAAERKRKLAKTSIPATIETAAPAANNAVKNQVVAPSPERSPRNE